ncbi:branched-chain amino acid ABC transporter permease [Spirochaeta lutea]|uniref:branched-chain amino acid ABC transporter permease n=1 Tax=Spirochaeta lutea TaxID=1480694 RepID=UPI0009DCD783|nr:branched-chain amino acid ABC transporter permease [Spirochaeta lutea]
MINFVLLLLVYMGIYSILALSQNLITGFGGMLSLAHAAFFAIGSYTTAIMMHSAAQAGAGFDLIWAFMLSALLSGLLGVLIGLPTLRLRGDYLAIATLGFGEITRNVILNWDSLTRGPMGFSGLAAPKILGLQLDPTNKWGYVIMTWLVVALVFLLLRRLTRSRIGRALDAVREDEIAAWSMGINITQYKVGAFIVGALVAGFAGTLWTAYNQSVSPNSFDFLLSVNVLCMVVLGGLGNHWGSILGAVLLVLVAELPRLLGLSSILPPQVRQILFGVVLVSMMIFRPQGIIVRRRPALPGRRAGGGGSSGGPGGGSGGRAGSSPGQGIGDAAVDVSGGDA